MNQLPRLKRNGVLNGCAPARIGDALFVFVLAFAIRVVRMPEVWGSSDAADVPLNILQGLCGVEGDWLERLLTYKTGALMPTASLGVMTWVKALGGSAEREWLWLLPHCIVSAVFVTLIFVVVRRLASRESAWWIAGFCALAPGLVLLSRSFAGPWVYSLAIQAAAFLIALQLQRAPGSERLRLGLSLILALNCWADGQMLGLLFPIAWMVVRAPSQLQRSSLLRRVLDGVKRPAWIPLWCGAAGIVIETYWGFGHLAHALKRKASSEVGWYLPNWWNDFVQNWGWASGCLLILGVSVGVVRILLRRTQTTAVGGLLLMGLCYSLPYWFLIGPKDTLTRGYSIYGSTWLLVFSSVVLWEALNTPKQRRALRSLNGLVLASLMLATGGAAYGLYPASWTGVSGFQGSYVADSGIKTAVALIVARSKNPNARVFSDASGGEGLEPSVMKFYFRAQPTLALSDARPRTKPYTWQQRKRVRFDYAVTLPENQDLSEKFLEPEFGLLAEIRNSAGKEALRLYERGYQGEAEALSTEGSSKVYRAVYPGFCSGY